MNDIPGNETRDIILDVTEKLIYRHGIAATGLAGRILAEAIRGQAGRLDAFARIPHRDFPGGRLLRTPLLVAGMAWFKLRDALF